MWIVSLGHPRSYRKGKKKSKRGDKHEVLNDHHVAATASYGHYY